MGPRQDLPKGATWRSPQWGQRSAVYRFRLSVALSLRFIKSNNLEPCMSRRSNCWDNAVAESFFSSLKKEGIKKRIYKTRDLARADIFDYIEMYYNHTRRKSYLGGVSPNEARACLRYRGKSNLRKSTWKRTIAWPWRALRLGGTWRYSIPNGDTSRWSEEHQIRYITNRLTSGRLHNRNDTYPTVQFLGSISNQLCWVALRIEFTYIFIKIL